MRLNCVTGWAAVGTLMGLLACSITPQPSTSQTIGAATLAVSAPAGVECLQITVFGGGGTVTDRFDVIPGTTTTLSLSGLPIGNDTFVGSAFGVACAEVTATDVPIWVTDPVTAQVASPPAVPTSVALSFRPNGLANVTIAFDGGVADGAAGLPPNTTSCNGQTCTCVAGFADCNGTLSDGCEVNVTADGNNCGACGNKCGAGQMCSGGSCKACVAGAVCSPGNACQVGAISCAGGTSACVAAANVANGTPCGTNEVCNNGVCAACTAGAGCNPGGNLCQVGAISCSSGIGACVAATNVADGTACGTNEVCSSGTCTACIAGAACTPGGNVCQTGTISCTGSSAACVAGASVPNGTPCGTNQVCSNGACAACTAGAACTPGGNVCQTGTISCATGASACVATANVANGTLCGTNQVCDNGTCGACVAGAACIPNGNACQTGTTSCATGASICVSTGNAVNGTACGTNATCNGGQCLNAFGDSVAFAPCSTASTQSFPAGLLSGELVAVSSAITLTDLGVIGSPSMPNGVRAILALYSNVGGKPSALLAQTGAGTVAAGNNQLPVTATRSLAAGSYWIVGEYSTTAHLCLDTVTSNTIDSAPGSFGTVPATFPTTVTQATGQPDINYYLAGTE